MFLGLTLGGLATVVGGYFARRALKSRAFIKTASRLVFARVMKVTGTTDKRVAHEAFMLMINAGARAIMAPLSAAEDKFADEIFELLWDEDSRGQFKAAQVKLGKRADRTARFVEQLKRMPDPMGRMP